MAIDVHDGGLALRDTLDEFLAAGPADRELREFLLTQLDWERYPGMTLVA